MSSRLPSPPPDALPTSFTHENSPQTATIGVSQNSPPPLHIQLHPSVFSSNTCVPPGTTMGRPSTTIVVSFIVWVVVRVVQL